MTKPERLFAGVALAAALAATGCGSSARQAVSRGAIEQAQADAYAQVSRRLYDEEQNGQPVQVAARLIAGLPALARAVERADSRAAVHALRHQPVRHAVRARITFANGALLADVGLPFVIGGQVHPYVSANGTPLGELEVSIQDAIGYVRLLQRLAGVQVVIRGERSHVATLLPAALNVALPASGPVVIAGAHYVVSSFTRRGFNAEPLRVWVLDRV